MLTVRIKENQYKSFIKYATENCDSFSLVFEKDSFHDIYYQLSEFALHKKNIGYHPDSGTFFENSELILYDCNKFTKSILQSEYNLINCFDEKFPSEICFYRKGIKWFLCISHEKYLFIYDETKKDVSFFNEVGIEYWRSI